MIKLNKNPIKCDDGSYIVFRRNRNGRTHCEKLTEDQFNTYNAMWQIPRMVCRRKNYSFSIERYKLAIEKLYNVYTISWLSEQTNIPLTTIKRLFYKQNLPTIDNFCKLVQLIFAREPQFNIFYLFNEDEPFVNSKEAVDKRLENAKKEQEIEIEYYKDVKKVWSEINPNVKYYSDYGSQSLEVRYPVELVDKDDD